MKNYVNFNEINDDVMFISTIENRGRKNRSSRLIDIQEDLIVSHEKLDVSTKSLFISSLKNNFLFKNFDESHYGEIMSTIKIYLNLLMQGSLKRYHIKKNFFLMKEDEYADSIFFIEEGTVLMIKNKNIIKKLERGYFLKIKICSLKFLYRRPNWRRNNSFYNTTLLQL